MYLWFKKMLTANILFWQPGCGFGGITDLFFLASMTLNGLSVLAIEA